MKHIIIPILILPILVTLVVVGSVSGLAAQQSKPEFDVASVRPFREQLTLSQIAASGAWARPGGAVKVTGATLEALIGYAYEIEPYQILDGPDWMRSDKFAIDARPGAEVSEAEAKRMLQSLLEDRFKLVTHEEQRDMRFYALIQARGDGRLGPYMRHFADTCTSEMSAEARKQFPPRVVDTDASGRGNRLNGSCSNGFSDMARSLSYIFRDLPFLDETGLTGRFTYEVRYTSSGDFFSDLRDALEDQLGLTLTVKRGPVDVLVIDSVEQPTEN